MCAVVVIAVDHILDEGVLPALTEVNSLHTNCLLARRKS